MTTLFKKLSITTLTLAIASGIVFSVGSSEPSTFEGQASGIPGAYTITLEDETFTASELVVTKINSLTTTFSVSGNANNSFPLTTSAAPLVLGFKTGNHLQEIRSITVVTTNATSLSVTFEDTVRDDAPASPTSGSPVTLISGTRYDTIQLGSPSSYPDRFVLTISGGDTKTLQSVIITFDC